MSPYVPFITESFYQNMRKCIPQGKNQMDSIHFLQIPEVRKELINPQIKEKIGKMQMVIENARKLRESHKISLKQPVNSLTILTTDESLLQSIQLLSKYIEEEINTPNVFVEKDLAQYIQLKAEPEVRLCGQELREKFGPDLIQQIKNFSQEQITLLKTEGKILLKVLLNTKKQTNEQSQQQSQLKNKQKEGNLVQEMECELLLKHVKITEQFNTKKHQNLLFTKEDGYSLIIDPSQTQQLKNLGLAREFTNRIQKLRKKAQLKQEDKVIVFYSFDKDSPVLQAVQSETEWIQNQIKKPLYPYSQRSFLNQQIALEKTEIDGQFLTLVIATYSPLFNKQKLQEQFDENKVDTIMRVLAVLENLQQTVEFSLDGQKITLGQNHYTIP